MRLSRIPDTFDEAEARLPNAVLFARYGVAKSTLTRWRRRFGVKKHGGGGSKSLNIPLDFAEQAKGRTNLDLARHYGRSLMTIAKWRKAFDIPRWVKPKKPVESRERPRAPAPVDLAEIAAEMSITAMAQHYGRDRRVVQRWLEEAGIVKERAAPTPRVRRGPPKRPKLHHVPGTFIYGKAPRISERKSGAEEEAAQHLRRLTFVYRCNHRGAADQKGRFWRFGNAVLDGEELIERARRKGWDPDAWRMVA